MIARPVFRIKIPLRRAGLGVPEEFKELQRGQIIVLFAASLMVFIGILGIAIDMSWVAVNEMRMQKAADAAALAGAVYLPPDPGTGTTKALAAAKANGYIDGVNGAVVNAHQDTALRDQMDVSVSAAVPTFFIRAFGFNSLTPTRSAKAQFRLPVPMGSPLNSFGDPTATDSSGNAMNFWAAVNGPCTLKEQGDPYATKATTSSQNNCSTLSVTNSEYSAPAPGDPGAYDYAIKVPSSGTITIQLYDPEFCYRNSQFQDAADTQWKAAGVTNDSNFDTIFTLYDPSDTPYDYADDHVRVSGVTYPGGASTGCTSTYVSGSSHDNYTGRWITYATVGASAGTYRLNVQTKANGSNPAYGSNQFGIKVTGVAGTQVYGLGAMSIYNNIASGNTMIYLAQIDAANAGKTMEVDLFDPGEVNGNAFLYFQMPNASGGVTEVPFNWCDDGLALDTTCSGTWHNGVGSLQTSNGSGLFNGHWVVVTIHIPDTYTAPGNGWWKIRYNISGTGAHDRTTWVVSIRDYPVHLVN